MALPDFTTMDAATYKAAIDQELSEINEVLKRTNNASAVNEITFDNAIVNNDPIISATGTDTNIGLEIKAKGNRIVSVQNKGILLSNSGTVTISNILTAATWDTEDYKDIPALHSTSVNPSRIIIPAGVNRVKFSGFLAISNQTSTGTLQAKVGKNGASTDFAGSSTHISDGSLTGTLPISTAVLEVVAGDYFELFVSSSHTASVRNIPSYFHMTCIS